MLGWIRELLMCEVRSRSLNELLMGSRTDAAPGDLTDLGCECSFEGCPSTISLTAGEYESIRSDGATFGIAIDHENPELDRVVSEHERYAIVEKWMKEAGSIARETDPRRPLSSETEAP